MSPVTNTLNMSDKEQMRLHLPGMIICAGELFDKGGDQLIFGRFNLTTTKYIILTNLAHLETKPSMTELKHLMLRSPSNMTQIVDSLERDGFVKRIPSPTDRRVTQIEITYEGHMLRQEVETFLKNQMQDLLHDFDAEELSGFLKTLTRLMGRCAEAMGQLEFELPVIEE